MRKLRQDEYLTIDFEVKRSKKDIYNLHNKPYCFVCGVEVWHSQSNFNENEKIICSNMCSNMFYQ